MHISYKDAHATTKKNLDLRAQVSRHARNLKKPAKDMHASMIHAQVP